MGPNIGVGGGRRQEKVEETHEAGRQLGSAASERTCWDTSVVVDEV